MAATPPPPVDPPGAPPAAPPARRSFLAEMADFLRENRNWWLVPILLVLGLVAALLVLTATGAGAFVYALF